MKKIVVLVSGSGSNLQAIIENCNAKYINAEIIGVISNNPDAFGLERAASANIDSTVINNKDYISRDHFDFELIKVLDDLNPDLIILAGFMRILTEKLTNRYIGKIINIHPSLLPKYPGLNTHEKINENKESHHGATVQFVDSGLDSGQIIGYSKFEVNDYDLTSLEQKVHEIEHKLLPLICSLIKNKRLKFENNVLEIDNIEYPDGKEFNF